MRSSTSGTRQQPEKSEQPEQSEQPSSLRRLGHERGSGLTEPSSSRTTAL
jgi:hypothetical protein